jgi:hypothetical protein
MPLEIRKTGEMNGPLPESSCMPIGPYAISWVPIWPVRIGLSRPALGSHILTIIRLPPSPGDLARNACQAIVADQPPEQAFAPLVHHYHECRASATGTAILEKRPSVAGRWHSVVAVICTFGARTPGREVDSAIYIHRGSFRGRRLLADARFPACFPAATHLLRAAEPGLPWRTQHGTIEWRQTQPDDMLL